MTQAGSGGHGMGAQEVGRAWQDFEPGWTWAVRGQVPRSWVGRVAVNLGKAGACHLDAVTGALG